MSGYTPLFQSLTTGTLCGRWPDIGLWPIVLSLANKSGEVDVTPAYLAGVTGLAIEEVVACMERFCAPDPYSRSTSDNGARLRLIDPDARKWGWVVVNHAKYREMARLKAKSAREVESGQNANRMQGRVSPPETAADRRSPPQTAPHTQTHTQTQTHIESKSAREGGDVPRRTIDGCEFVDKRLRPAYPRGTFRHTHWLLAGRSVERLVDAGADPDEIVANAEAYQRQQEAMGNEGTQFVKAPSRWLDDGDWRGPFPIPESQRKPGQELPMDRIYQATGGDA